MRRKTKNERGYEREYVFTKAVFRRHIVDPFFEQYMAACLRCRAEAHDRAVIKRPEIPQD